jgi:hypothetical protein
MAKRGYRSMLNGAKQEALVWEEMKKLHADAEWRSGVYEGDRYIETVFSIAEETPGVYQYWITDNELHCTVKVLDGFSPELTTDVFVLASHFNNHLKNGVVAVNVDAATVSYRLKQNMLVPLLHKGEIYEQLVSHHNISKDVYWAFQRLLREDEEPAIIFADLMKKIDQNRAEAETN